MYTKLVQKWYVRINFSCMSAAHTKFVKSELDGAFAGLAGADLASADLTALSDAAQAELLVHFD